MYKGGTIIPPYTVQGSYCRTSRGTAVPPEGTSAVLSCLFDSARRALSTPYDPPPPLEIVTTPKANLNSGRTLGLGPLRERERETRQTAKTQKKTKKIKKDISVQGCIRQNHPLETTLLGTSDSLQKCLCAI